MKFTLNFGPGYIIIGLLILGLFQGWTWLVILTSALLFLGLVSTFILKMGWLD